MKRHSFDPISFFSGLAIAAIGLVFLVANTPSEIIAAITDLSSWFWPAMLLVIGAAILIPIFLPGRREDDDQSITSG